MRKLNAVCILLLLFSLVASSAQESARKAADLGTNTPFQDAVAAWHFQTEVDSTIKPSNLVSRGKIELGTELSPQDREDSHARGGDGWGVRLDGEGWLDAGAGSEDELQLTGDQLTMLIRIRSPKGFWETRGLFSKGGGHDRLVVNFFSHDFGDGPEVGFEMGIEGKAGLGGQVRVPLEKIGRSDWHDFIARYNGKQLQLFANGVLVATQEVTGKLRTGNTEPLAIGAGTSGAHVDSPFVGLLDHAAVWQRALSDEEILFLSGGPAVAAANKSRFDQWQPPPRKTATHELLLKSRELQTKHLNDPWRPRWHFTAPEEGDCMPFDPNGAIYWKGRYHLFYIFQRADAKLGEVHCWGHASSIDLVHWTQHPIGLDVNPGDVDQGIFSGNAFLDAEGIPTIMYHGVGVGNCVAQATDSKLIHWKKLPTNPIVPQPKPGEPNHGKFESWDPHGWYENGNYYAIFGGARAVLMKGTSLNQLEFQHPFLELDPWSEEGEDLSCPDFFPLGDKHVLLCISHRRGARYYIGDWKDDRFVPLSHGKMNWLGGSCFAPETLLDDQGRRIFWAWAFDFRSDSNRRNSGWSGVMTMPRVLELNADHELVVKPAPELERLRLLPTRLSAEPVRFANEIPFDGVSGSSLEIHAEFGVSSAKQFGIKVGVSPEGDEETAILFDPTRQEVRIDFSKSSADPSIRYKNWFFHTPNDPNEVNRKPTEQVARFHLKDGERLRIRAFLDHSILEVFVNDRLCLTQRVYPTSSERGRVSFVSEGGETELIRAEAWEMAEANLR